MLKRKNLSYLQILPKNVKTWNALRATNANWQNLTRKTLFHVAYHKCVLLKCTTCNIGLHLHLEDPHKTVESLYVVRMNDAL